MQYSVQDIADALNGRLEGDGSLLISGATEPSLAGVEDLALAMDPKYADGFEQSQAKAAVLWEGADWQALGLSAAIFIPRARYAMSGLTSLLDAGPEIAPGVHPSAVIDASASIGDGAAIGPLVVIGARVQLGENARISSHVSISEDAIIGDNALLHSGVRVAAKVRIGDRFIAQPGAVIGGDGFSFVTPEKSRVEEARESLGKDAEGTNTSWTRIHSLGSVVIGDDVEVGANSTIDAGTVRPTRVGNRTKMDSQVHIGHNVEIGEDVLICGQAGVAGSSKIGNRVVLGGQSGVSDNITIGDDVVAGGATKMLTKVPAGRVVLGYPAMKMEQFIEAGQNWRRLPRFMNDVRKMKKAVLNPDKDD